jgi:hypothetical protein
MAERFNRRIAEAIGRERKRGIAHRLFASHADRNAFLNQFVHDYNHTRLKCLGYLASLQALDNLAGPNTFAGMTIMRVGKSVFTRTDQASGCRSVSDPAANAIVAPEGQRPVRGPSLTSRARVCGWCCWCGRPPNGIECQSEPV